jgi:cytochrome c
MRLAFAPACLFLALTALPADAANAAHGAERFKVMCATCHAIDPAQKKMAPHLKGIVGRKAGSVDGATYSPAMKAAGWTWDEAKLEAFLADPRKTLAGTTMMMGVTNATDRADIIAYLKTVK